MPIFKGLLWILFVIASLGLILGLIRPVYSLWYLDRMNRRKVLKMYGLPLILVGIIILLFA